MAKATINSVNQASYALDGLCRGFVVVLHDNIGGQLNRIPDVESFNEDIDAVRAYADEWYSEECYTIHPATLSWRGAIEEGGTELICHAPQANRSEQTKSLFE